MTAQNDIAMSTIHTSIQDTAYKDTAIQHIKCEIHATIAVIMCFYMQHRSSIQSNAHTEMLRSIMQRIVRIDMLFTACCSETEHAEPQDTARFLRRVLTMCKTGNDTTLSMHRYPHNLAEMFYVHMNTAVSCMKCLKHTDKREKCSVIYLKPGQSVQQYFEIKQLDKTCFCRAKKLTTRSVLSSITRVLAIRVRRMENHALGETDAFEVQTHISVPYVTSEIDSTCAVHLCVPVDISALQHALSSDNISMPDELVHAMHDADMPLCV